MSESYDVVVVGGGPAGSTTAALLAKEGLSVLVLEKREFPRFSVGESLMPESYWTLERLGMIDKLNKSRFTEKFSVQFVSSTGRESKPFYFSETNDGPSSMTWQVLRSEFDAMLLENAAEHGAEVRHDLRVEKVLFEGDQAVGVQLVSPDGNGTPNEIRAKVVVDASGRSSVLSRQLRLREKYPELKRISMFSYFENGRRDEGIDEGVTRAVKIRDDLGWFWYIPLPDNQVSVGVVAEPWVLYEGRERDLEKIFDEEISLSPWISDRLSEATRIMDVKVLSDFSYRSRRMAGDGWVLVGDAFGFVEPIYASGVFLALVSGEMAADAILDAFEKDDMSGTILGSFGEKLSEGIETVRKMVAAFYSSEFNFAEFVKAHPEQRMNIIDILVGSIFEDGVQDLFPVLEQYFPLPTAMPLESPAEPITVSS